MRASCLLNIVATASGLMLSRPFSSATVASARQNLRMVTIGDSCTGTCKWFDATKGFGFITIDGEENDIFVHQSEIYAPGFRSLADGEKLEFKVEADDRTGGLSAQVPQPTVRITL